MIKYNKNIDNIVRIEQVYSSKTNLRLHASERDSKFTYNMWKDFLDSVGEEDIRYYPDISKGYDTLEKIVNIDRKNMVLFDGSDRAIRNIFQVYVEPESKIITTTPGFPMYKVYADMFNGNLIEVPYVSYTFPLNEIIAAIDYDTNLLILSNPNSPLGNIITREEIMILLEHCERYDVLLVIDEAYIEFSNQSSLADISVSHNNVIVIKTMSKGWGSAGLRIGYTISNEKNAMILNKIRSQNDITSFSIAWLEIILKYKHEIETYIENVKVNRDHLTELLKDRNAKFINSNTNFIHVAIKEDFKNIVTKRCILLDNEYVRLSIPGDNKNYQHLLKQLIERL
jgi:histidinol-phosphate aminotransferase